MGLLTALLTAALLSGAAAAVRPHPRVEIDAQQLKQVRALRETRDPAWTRFEQSIKTQPGGVRSDNVTACAFASLVTGEKEYFDSAWNAVRTRIYRNGTDRVGGQEPAETPHGDLFYQGRSARHFHRHVKDFWIKDFSEGVIPNHKSFNWPPQRAHESAEEAYVPVYGPGYGRWRLEITGR